MLPELPDPRDDLSGLEGRLAAWRPSAGGLDRDRLLFEAGREAARAEAGARLRLAVGSAAALAAVAIGLGGLLAAERGHRLDLEVALARASAEPEPGPVREPAPEAGPRLVELSAPPSPTSYLALTHRALGRPGLDRDGDDDLDPPDGPADAATRPETLRVRGGEGRLGL